MQLRKLIESAKWMLLCGALAVLPAQAAAVTDAPPRYRLCQPCTMPALSIAMPHHGMVLAYGSFLSSGSLWYVVDLERGEATRIQARAERSADRNLHKLVIVDQTTRAMPDHELSRLKQIDKEIWALENKLPMHFATDVTWDLWLLDDPDVRRESAPGVPAGPAKEIELMMQRILERPAPSE
jgi:hypothetical protein